mmetsp:Transcript_27481/g.60849  ORF Transcript_27481/g.60849 Transcript_27481/m.60849 type:complete len:220 (-) Transcript_27481:18-677(-)
MSNTFKLLDWDSVFASPSELSTPLTLAAWLCTSRSEEKAPRSTERIDVATVGVSRRLFLGREVLEVELERRRGVFTTGVGSPFSATFAFAFALEVRAFLKEALFPTLLPLWLPFVFGGTVCDRDIATEDREKEGGGAARVSFCLCACTLRSGSLPPMPPMPPMPLWGVVFLILDSLCRLVRMSSSISSRVVWILGLWSSGGAGSEGWEGADAYCCMWPL